MIDIFRSLAADTDYRESAVLRADCSRSTTGPSTTKLNKSV